MDTSRRRFLNSFLAAPAVIAANRLMPVKLFVTPRYVAMSPALSAEYGIIGVPNAMANPRLIKTYSEFLMMFSFPAHPQVTRVLNATLPTFPALR